jgi:putative ABC transport system permease protein
VNGSIYLAWRYLSYHRFKTAILVLSITLIVYVPVGLRVLVSQSAEQLTARAGATPLLIGAKGSPLELVLNSLYFESATPEPLGFDQALKVVDSGLALPIPMHVRFRVQEQPIVGTSLDYFRFRGLEIAAGRLMTTLGECVLGAAAARELDKVPGDSVVSSPETVFDIAGTYPLKMRVAGVLAANHTPDDGAVFVDLKTAWVIQGLGHGHEDLSRPSANAQVLSREGDKIVANASVQQYQEITADNLDSFHFHGDQADYPITAVIAVPPDQRSSALLRGRYLSDGETSQILVPERVMDELLSTIFTVQTYVVAAVIFVGVSTLMTSILVFLLSLRLRRREIETMIKIGGGRTNVASILSLEVAFVVALSVALAAGLMALTARYGSELIQSLILG